MPESLLIPKIDPTNSDIKPEKRHKKLVFLISCLLVVATILLFAVPLTVFGLKLNTSYKKLSPLLSNFDLSDVAGVKNDFATVKNEVISINSSYKLISWMEFVPFMGVYVKDLGLGLSGTLYALDAAEIAITTVEPYLSVLGYDTADNAEKTAQERIDIIVSALPEITPRISEISSKIKNADNQFSQIDPLRYPKEVKEVELRFQIVKILDYLHQSAKYLDGLQPILAAAPDLLGVESPKNYLVLFQNDKELRATGGFLTAYSIMKVDRARFEPVDSADIYHLDAVYKPSLPAPQPIIDLIKGPYILSKNIRLRDMNYSPDFPTSMKLFSEEAGKVNLPDVDGIIAVDTGLLVNLLDVLGEIGVPGYGNFSNKIEAKCNCPQVIYELESFADTEGPIVWDPNTGKIVYTPPNYDNRKKIIGPLMNSILANALAQPKEKLPSLLAAVFNSVFEKHVLFYNYNPKNQEAIENFGIGGKILPYTGDYLHINDNNLGGRKSNLYATSEVHQQIETDENGLITKTVTITYNNPEKHDGWLNSVLPNWVRVYVPKGSELVVSEGLEQKYETIEELDKTVFGGYFKLRPEGVSKITFKYTLPFKNTGDYKILIQKQPGTYSPLYVVETEKSTKEFFLTTDREIRL